MRARDLRPLVQGDLDGLCGVYAILNALRVAHANRRSRVREASREPPLIEGSLADEMFLALVRTIRGHSIDDPVVWGIGAARLWRLLRVAGRWLERNHGFAIDVERPFPPRRRPRRATVLTRIQEHLQDEGTAAIVGSRWPWGHWTVVRKVGRTRLVLADSGGWHYVPLQRGRQRHAAHAGLILSDHVFLLSIRPVDGWVSLSDAVDRLLRGQHLLVRYSSLGADRASPRNPW